MNPQIRQLFRSLLYMGKDYPAESGGYQKFSRSLKAAFRKTPVNSEEDLNKALQKGEYITKELEALYFLRRYRQLKRTYYND